MHDETSKAGELWSANLDLRLNAGWAMTLLDFESCWKPGNIRNYEDNIYLLRYLAVTKIFERSYRTLTYLTAFG